MKSSRLLPLLAILVVPASFVSSSALCAKARATDGPMLLAVELQPEDPMPGGQFVWILNPSKEELDLSCWVLRSEKAGVLMIASPVFSSPRAESPTSCPRKPGSLLPNKSGSWTPNNASSTRRLSSPMTDSTISSGSATREANGGSAGLRFRGNL